MRQITSTRALLDHISAMSQPVFPLKPKTKLPVLKNFKKLAVPVTTQIINEVKNGQCNLGRAIRTDEFVVDFDTKESLGQLEKLLGVRFADHVAWYVSSPNGYQFFFKKPKNVPTNNLRKKIPALEDIDFLTANLLTAIPPSIGRLKRWSEKKQKYVTTNKLASYEFVLGTANKNGLPPKEFIRWLKNVHKKLKREGKKYLAEKEQDTVSSKPTKGRQLSQENLQLILDNTPVEDALPDYDSYIRFVAPIHYTTNGDENARKLFQAWAIEQKGYDTKKDYKRVQLEWRAFSKSKSRHRKAGSLIAILEDISTLSRTKILSCFPDVDVQAQRVRALRDGVNASDVDQSIKTKKNKGQTITPIEETIAVLNSLDDITDTANSHYVDDALRIFLDCTDMTKRTQALEQLRKSLGWTKAELGRARLRIQKEKKNSTFTLDEIERLITKLIDKENGHDLMYTCGRYYESNGHGLWKHTGSDIVQAWVLELAESYYTESSEKPINALVQDTMKRLPFVINADSVFIKHVENDKFPEKVRDQLNQLEYRTTDRFINDENLAVSAGIYKTLLHNGELVVDVNAKSKKCFRPDVYEHVGKLKTIEQLLMLPIDEKINALDVTTINKNTKHLKYVAVTNARYMTDAALSKAIANGKCKNIVYFLKCITDGLGKRDRNEFITAYLDALAFMSQPIKNHVGFFYFYGNGDNGKSFAMMLLGLIFGSSRINDKAFSSLIDNPRFYEKQIRNSYCVYDDDLQSYSKETIDMIKKRSSGNRVITPENKGTDDLIPYLYKGNFAFSSNLRIAIDDSTHGMSRRLFSFKFENNLGGVFTKENNGVPLIEKELDYLFNILRYRTPRMIVTGPTHTRKMHDDNDALTRGKPLDRILIKHLRTHNRKSVDIVKLHSFINEKMMDIGNMQRNNIISEKAIVDKIAQLGFDIDAQGMIANAKLQK